ncbi:MAG TPA: hypothetical protein VHP32_06870 [Ignavibacteria bacterium]|nr:hypothetical protein [Ignavibacteria bacterium]
MGQLKQINTLSNEEIVELIGNEEAQLLDRLNSLRNEIGEFKSNLINKEINDFRESILNIQDSMENLFYAEELIIPSLDLSLPEPSPTIIIKNENKQLLEYYNELTELVRDEGEIIFNLQSMEEILIVLIDAFERLTHKKRILLSCCEH